MYKNQLSMYEDIDASKAIKNTELNYFLLYNTTIIPLCKCACVL